jgi:hypothetical protein
MGRRYIGIDINPAYIKLAQQRTNAPGHEPLLLVGCARYPGKEELAEMVVTDAVGTNGKDAGQKKHKRKTYGRKVEIKQDEQLKLV